jgi:hypothetical protein
MNEACQVMQRLLEEKYLPALKDNPTLNKHLFKQTVSGSEGTIFELDLGKFTQEEFVLVFELCVGVYHVNRFAETITGDGEQLAV